MYQVQSRPLGFAPAAVVSAVNAAKPVFNVVSNVFGGKPKPLAVPVDAVLALIARLSPGERAQLDALVRPFGWYNASALEANAGKIAAELRDAKNPGEIALYNFIAARISVQPQAAYAPSFVDESAAAVKDIIFRRAAETPELQRATAQVVQERVREATFFSGPMLFAAGAVLFMMSRKRR
jgi:hypothetical protein